jgi:O-antigen/teichoic acid export membrane protein
LLRILRNLVLGGIASKVLLGLSNVLVIKALSKSDYAQLSNFLFIQSLISGLLFSPFLLTSVIGANLRGIQNSRRLFSALNLVQINLVLLLFGLALLYGRQLAVDLFHKPEFYVSLLFGLLSSVLLTFQNVVLSRHQANEKFGLYTLINLLRPFALILILSGLWFFDALTFWTTSLAFLVSLAISVAGESRFLIDALRVKGYRFRFGQFIWFWTSFRLLIIFFLIRATLDHIATFMVSRYFSLDDNANFGVAFRYYAMVDLILFSAHVVFMNAFTRDPLPDVRVRFQKWMWAMAGLSGIGLAFLPFGSPIFALVNGQRYAEAYPIFAMFMAGLVVYLIASPVIYGVARLGGFRFLFWMGLIALAFQLAMTRYAAFCQNLVWMAAASVLSRGFLYVSSLVYFYRKS